MKRRDWANFISTFGKVPQRPDIDAVPVKQSRDKPGPKPDPDWPDAIAKVTAECVAAGFKQPLKRGEKTAIQTMLLDFMRDRDKFPSEDSARKYANQVIMQLPDNSI